MRLRPESVKKPPVLPGPEQGEGCRTPEPLPLIYKRSEAERRVAGGGNGEDGGECRGRKAGAGLPKAGQVDTSEGREQGETNP